MLLHKDGRYGHGEKMSGFNRPNFIFRIQDSQQLEVRDFRGFTVFAVNSAGDVKRKGRDIKLP